MAERENGAGVWCVRVRLADGDTAVRHTPTEHEQSPVVTTATHLNCHHCGHTHTHTHTHMLVFVVYGDSP